MMIMTRLCESRTTPRETVCVIAVWDTDDGTRMVEYVLPDGWTSETPLDVFLRFYDESGYERDTSG